jgi:hypothetical protein
LDTTRRFVMTAIARKEMRAMPPENFWLLVYAPLYQLVCFAQQDSSFFCQSSSPAKFQLNDASLDLALQCVLRTVRP